MTTNGSPHEQPAKVAQASGMVSVQARYSVDHAMLLMSERAVMQSQTLDQIANGVVEHSIHFG